MLSSDDLTLGPCTAPSDAQMGMLKQKLIFPVMLGIGTSHAGSLVVRDNQISQLYDTKPSGLGSVGRTG